MASNSQERSTKRQLPIGSRVEAVLEAAYRARRPAMLEGPTGIGKSELVHHVANKLGIECVVLDLSLLEPPDLVGLPVIAEGRTSYACPKFLPTEGAGILMLEELNRAERYIQQPAMQLLTARRLHEYELPDGWCAFCAINPEDGEYQVTPLDPALRARFLGLAVRADRREWIAWAEANGVHSAVLNVAREHDRFLDGVPPRTWKYASDVLFALDANDMGDEAFLRDLLSGYLPEPWIDAVLDSISSCGSSLGVDLYAAIRDVGGGSELGATVRSLVDSGATDRLDEITARLGGILESSELGALSGRGEFCLSAFEAILAELPGDYRELLQEAFAGNPLSLQLVELHPDDVLYRYQTAPISAKIALWLKDDVYRHRAWSVAWSLAAYLRRNADLIEIRRNNGVKANLGRFIADLGDAWAAPLVEGLRGIGISPLRPRGGRVK